MKKLILALGLMCIGELSFAQLFVDFSRDTVCLGDSTHLISNSSTTLGAITATNWDLDNDGSFDDANGTDIFNTFSTAGTFTVGLQVVTDISGTSSVYKTVIIKPVPVAGFQTVGVCSGNSTHFFNFSTVSGGVSMSYSWDFGDSNSGTGTTPNHTYAAAGAYTAILTANANGCTDTDTNTVTVFSLPVAQITATTSTSFCKGDSASLMGDTATALTQYWSTGENSNTITVGDSGYVSIVVVDGNGCSDHDSIQLFVNLLPSVQAFGDTTILAGEPAQISASGASSYVWSPDNGLSSTTSANPTASPWWTDTYKVVGTDGNGCKDSSEVTVTVITQETVELEMNNVVTPNGDGKNDVWMISNLDFYQGCTFIVVNKWGQTMMTTDNYLNDWGGTFNGKVLPEGTYYYMINCEDNRKTTNGPITILR